MIRLEVFGPTEDVERIEALLDGSEGISRVRSVKAVRADYSVITATVQDRPIDDLIDQLRGIGVEDEDFTLTRVDEVRMARATEQGLTWEDVLGHARTNARPVYHYVAFMVVAGIIAGYGVIDGNVILIVGAMAVSPDLLPITAIAVGIAGQSAYLASRALGTLLLGMAVAVCAAGTTTFLQKTFDLIPSSFSVNSTIIGGLTQVSNETIVVAFAAGAVGMLALETRTRSAVGVAISVTTIPAAAYLGVAVGLGNTEKFGGALAVLGTNVVMMVIGATAVLAVQRRVNRG